MNKRFFCINITTLLLINFNVVFSQSSWFEQNYSSIKTSFSSVRFLNNNTGYITSTLGKCVVLKTTDSGNNWIDHSNGLELFSHSFGYKVNLWSNYFIDNNTGWAIGEYLLSNGFFNKVIIKTTNSGDNWDNNLILPKSYLNYIYFFDISNGWVIGDKGSIISTMDGGLKWISQNSGTSNNLVYIYFINKSKGWIVGENGVILKTTNGGNIWELQSSQTYNYLYSIFFINNDIGWIVGKDGIVLKTTNGGNNWVKNNIDDELSFSSVFFVDSNTGYIAGTGQTSNLEPIYGVIYKTTNGGEDWVNQLKLAKNDFASICFIDNNTGWVVGSSIFKTIDGGEVDEEIYNQNNTEDQNNLIDIDHSPMIESYLPEMEIVARSKAQSLHPLSSIEDVASDEYFIDIQDNDYVEVNKKYYINMKGSLLGINKYKVIMLVIASFEKLQNGQWRSSVKNIDLISD